MAANEGLPMLCPPVRLCMDNGIMVAWTACSGSVLASSISPSARRQTRSS